MNADRERPELSDRDRERERRRRRLAEVFGDVLPEQTRDDAVDPQVQVDGDEVHLTPTEFDLLQALAAAPGHVLTRERLLAGVWGWEGGAGATRTVDSHVRSLRAKAGAERVRTVLGVGYALEPR